MLEVCHKLDLVVVHRLKWEAAVVAVEAVVAVVD